MPGKMHCPEIRVEGENDQFPLIYLLQKHGVDYDKKPWPEDFPKFIVTGGVDELLAGMVDEIKRSSPHPIGFVLDADSPISSRWKEVVSKLHEVEVSAPATPPATGLIIDVPKYKTTVGVWLMPDNEREGKTEDFLKTLIADGDALIEHASESTDLAVQKGAAFAPKDRSKAVLFTWLAWQEEPGQTYGRAVAKRYFDHDHELVLRFVKWFKDLYGIA